MPFDIEWPITVLFTGKKRGHGAAVTVRHVQNVNPKQRMRWTDKYCSFPEIMSPPRLPPLHPQLPQPKKHGIHIYIYGGFLERAVMTPIPNDVSVSGNTVGEERRQQLKKKARMIQSLRIPYFRCKMDIRVETWQSAPALTGSGIDNDQWLGQWDVSVQAGKLIKWH